MAVQDDMLFKDFQHIPACLKEGILLNLCIDTSKPVLQQLNRKVILKAIMTTSLLLQTGPGFSLTGFLRQLSFHLCSMASN